MTSLSALMYDAILRSIQAEKDARAVVEDALRSPSSKDINPPSPIRNVYGVRTIDPLDRERIIGERLSDLSDSLGVRYRQVCRDLRDHSRLAWTSDAHELRDILATVLRTLAPTEDVKATNWYKQEQSTNGPTQAQRTRFILSQVRTQIEARQTADEIALIDELISRIVRSTYSGGSQLAHTDATHDDCVRLLFHFDALMFSLLNSSSDESA